MLDTVKKPERVLNYRPEVDGLRALAVIAVVLFHADFEWIPGGFLGVDVFFVISGYLITSIVCGKIDKQSFSLVDFYVRRVRRLMPAVWVLILAVLVAGWFILFAGDYKNLAESAMATALSVSNIYFWQNSGYFSPAAEFKPLLHTWSLAVEEQYYFFYPLFLLLLCRCSPKHRAKVMIVLTLLAFACTVFITQKASSAAFYLLPSRAWELLLGGGVALIPTGEWKQTRLLQGLGWTGLAAIIASFFLLDPKAAIPAEGAVPACLGAAIFIACVRGKGLLAKAMSQTIWIAIGQMSYSIYLWHWPVIVFLRHARPSIKVAELVCYFVLTFLLGYLSWRWIETPVRHWRPTAKPWQVFASVGLGIIALIGVSLGITFADGVPGRMDPAIERYANAAHEPYAIPNIRKPSDAVVIGAQNTQPQIAIWGDSHVRALGSVLGQICDDQGKALVVYSRSSTPPVIGIRRTGNVDITKYNQQVFEDIRRRHIKRVYLHALWSSCFETGFVAVDEDGNYLEGPEAIQKQIRTTIQMLRDADILVTVIMPVPLPGFDVPSTLARTQWRGEEPKKVWGTDNYNQRNQELLSAVTAFSVDNDDPGFSVIHINDLFATDHGSRVALDGKALYRDTDHLSGRGAELIARRLRESLQSD